MYVCVEKRKKRTTKRALINVPEGVGRAYREICRKRNVILGVYGFQIV